MKTQINYDAILEDIDTDLRKCLFSKKLKFLMKFAGREIILDFFNEVSHINPVDVETKKKIFSRFRRDSDNKGLKEQWVRCNSRFLFNVIMSITQNTLSFEHLKRKRGRIILEDYEYLIFQGKGHILCYQDFHDEYDDAKMYRHLHDAVKRTIGSFYNANGIYFLHNIKATYECKDQAIYLKNDGAFDWRNVYIEAWCIDLKRRLAMPDPLGRPPAPYPICIDIPLIRSQETIKLPIDKKVTGNKLTNELQAICLWCKKPRGGIGYHKVLNNLFMQEKDDGNNIPVLIKDFDRHIDGFPSPFP